jgi:hypothetical protein
MQSALASAATLVSASSRLVFALEAGFGFC